MRHAVTVARVLLGLVFFVFGLNGFLNFMPAPDPATMPEREVAFAGALAATKYMFPLIKGTEVLGGAFLLSNRFVPLGLTLLAPILVNIFAFHAFLSKPNAMSIILIGIEIFLAWSYRDAFRPMLAAKVSPTLGAEPAKSAAVAASVKA